MNIEQQSRKLSIDNKRSEDSSFAIYNDSDIENITGIFRLNEECNLVLSYFDAEKWTLFTSKRIVNKFDGAYSSIKLEDISKIFIGNFQFDLILKDRTEKKIFITPSSQLSIIESLEFLFEKKYGRDIFFVNPD